MDVDGGGSSNDLSVAFDCEARGVPQPEYQWYEENNGVSLRPRNLLRLGAIMLCIITHRHWVF